jgi:branched-chain amino acid transport system ATP-binding protein
VTAGPGLQLRAEALDKKFGGVVAARDVTLGVAKGEFRCIIGPNGAGKSTLFSMLCGIIRPDSGRIFLDGADVTRLPAFRRVRMGLGLTFQTNRAFHALSVEQNLEIAARGAREEGDGDPARRFRHALSLFEFDLGDERPARELPHHRLQWLEIAMVLAGRPEILLLDEPTAGMSPDETIQTAKVLQHLNETGLTIVVVEHDIAFVRRVARLVTLLHQGAVFAEGTVADITAREDVRKIYLGRA